MKTVALASLIALAAGGSSAAMPGGLSQFQWEKRVLILFASPDDATYLKQRQIIDAQQAGLAERDMVVIRIDGAAAELVFGTAKNIDANAISREVSFQPDAGFQAILIGKDGGVKLRETRAVSEEALFGLIDSMPMRARERK
ncbi:DUF4174 domain-containing protein [Pararhizobium gei]|uniref:DUF4174 domain-containing protein n=1 Tax=Pararhizobium gei TaxID=1395951 RepID=UPI0023DCC660|nr:DUF4174 domain-containing protein [Rhizobium gei]